MRKFFITGFAILILFFSLIYLTKNIGFVLIVKSYLPESIYSIGRIVFKNDLNTKRLNNDYNVKFLPETQFENLELKKIDLTKFISKINSGYVDHLSQKGVFPYYIDQTEEKIYIADTGNNFLYFKKENLNNKFLPIKINSNLESNKILDIEINNNVIYVSNIKLKDNCQHLVVSKSILNDKEFFFEEIFFSEECMNHIQSGRMQIFIDNGSENLLLATAGDIGKFRNQIDNRAQDKSSIYGKIISINLKTYSHEIYSMGHRNILGLYADKDLILSTENGPRGGDEINKILKNKNYGWNISSYGEAYGDNAHSKVDYLKNHEIHGFEEPIFSFVPSIGISEIIKINNDFSIHWEDNFLIGSLNSKHLYRVKFDKNYNKLIFFEKFFIGERIRDLIYMNKYKFILLALEESGSLAILKKIK